MRTGKAKLMASDIPYGPGAESSELIALIPQMRAFARSLCRDRTEAEDLAQDALTNAWRNRSAYTPGSNLKAWVFRIIRNQFYSDRRRSWRVLQLDPTQAEETLVAVSDPSAALELDDVRRAMSELSDEQREALTLIGVAGLSYSEAAAICDSVEGTIKSRVSRARQRLLAILSHDSLTDRSRVGGDVMASMTAEAEQLRARRASPMRGAIAGGLQALGDDRPHVYR
jgi:RNA polymerase sigma-70 factor, ECF subfamily